MHLKKINQIYHQRKLLLFEILKMITNSVMITQNGSSCLLMKDDTTQVRNGFFGQSHKKTRNTD